MGILKDWVKSIVCCLCFMQIIEQLLPNGSYRKYVRFFCGLLLIILTISPFADVAGLSETFEKEWRMAALEESWDSMNLEQEGLEQLREKTIREACVEELERQIAEVARGNGMQEAEAEIELSEDGEEALKIEKVSIRGLFGGQEEEQICEDIRQELASVYEISETQIFIWQTGGVIGNGR